MSEATVRPGLFRNADFLKLWVAQVLSYVGDRVLQMAFLAWLVASYARSGSEMGRITFFGLLPAFILGGAAGAAADRLPRKAILVLSTVLRAAFVAAVAALLVGKDLPDAWIYGAIFLSGACTAFFVPARLSILPNIVADEDLQAANAMSAGAGMIATLIGTYIAGVLIQKMGHQGGFWVNSGVYAVAALMLLTLRPRASAAAAAKAPAGVAGAWSYLRTHRRTREFIVLSCALSFLSSFFYVALTVLAIDYFKLGTEGTGKLLSMVGVGMLAGSALAALLAKKAKATPVIAVSFLVLCLTNATARLVDSYALAWIWLSAIGAANALVLVTIDTVMQRITPDRFRGKVFGARGMVTSGVFLASLLGVTELLKAASPFDVFAILAWTSLAVAAAVLLFQENFAYRVLRFIPQAILRCFFSLRVEGSEFVRHRSRVIFAGNHTGLLDGPVLVSAVRRPIKFLVSRKVFSWPVIGPIVQRAGVIPVEDGKGYLAVDRSLAELRSGRAIGIFPEGRLTRDGSIGPFHKGVARLQKESGAPIVPFVIHGGFEAWPWNRKFPKARKVIVQFGQPIQAAGKEEKELLEEVRQRVQFMKESLDRREKASRSEEAYRESALSLMQQKSDDFGGRAALLLKEKSGWKELSYSELSRRSRDLSDRLLEGGFPRGERIAILSESRPEWAVAFFASIRSGAVTVPLDIKLTDAELKSILTDCAPRVLFVSREHLPSAKVLKEAVPSIEKIVLLDELAAEGDEFPVYGALRSKAVLDGVERRPDETALIIYTSGTTGNPKGVMISFSNLVFEVKHFEKMMELTPGDRFLSILPLNHLLELTAGFLGVLHAGGQVCYSQSLSPNEIAKAMKEKRVTFMIAVPLFLKLLKGSVDRQVKKMAPREQKAFKLMYAVAQMVPSRAFRRLLFGRIHEQFGGRLRGFLSGGAPLDVEVGEFFETIGIPVYQGYGLSETSPVITGNTPSHNRLGSVGRALKGVEVRIAEASGPDQEGEILTRGPHVMQGYYKREDLTKEVIDAEGWFHTGDLGKLDRDGYLYITGRIKNLIVLGGGKKIHPEEVEAVLSNTPFLKEVCVLSRVLKGGLKDGTEEVCAVVVPSDDLRKRHADAALLEVELKKAIDPLNQNLAPYKRPTRILVYPEDLPKTATRKIRRPLVSEWAKNLPEAS